MQLQYITDEVRPGVHGGELNDEELLYLLSNALSTDVIFNRSSAPALQDEAYFRDNKKCKFILNSFLYLPHRDVIADELDYVLYEHENKYAGVPGDPSCFVNYKVPHVAYKRLYARAKAVLCQSRLHAETVKKNIPEANVVNLSGNVWTTHALDRMQELADAPKSDKVFLYDNTHPFKNLQYNQKFCEKHNITYDKIGGLKPDEFLTQAATYKAFVYFPGWLESLNRMAVECRMMRVGVVTDELLGAASEDWFKLEGHELIELMRGRRLEIVNKVLQAFD